MKREYVKPSMAMNLFDTADRTNAITVLSSVAPGTVTKQVTRIGVAVINGSKLNS